jgi:hypothetical protein
MSVQTSAAAKARAAVTVSPRPLWSMRLTRALPRYMLCTLSAAGIIASARFAIAPPRSRVAASATAVPAPADRAAEGFAALFARRYLSWSAAEPLASERALESYAGVGVEAGVGLRLPVNGAQRVEWAEVVQSREPVPRMHVYTVATQTDSAGLVYLSVGVTRGADGRLRLAGYPAFVGAPAQGPAQSLRQLPEVTDAALQTVVERALRNYLAGSEANLAADLTGDAQVALPQLGLNLVSLARARWARGGGAVVAVVQAQDSRGTRYALQYEIDVRRVGSRWEVSAVQMDPYA